MSGFEHHLRSGQVIATFTGFEADLLRNLASQMIELLSNEVAAPTGGIDPLEELLDFSGPIDEPEDPVLLRLLPTAYPDDDEAAGEFRRFTERSLRDAKAIAAASIIDLLEEAGLPDELSDSGLMIDVELPPESSLLWLEGLTDLRLALATRLGIEDGDDDFWLALPEEDPRSQAHDIYEWLGYLQETLVAAVSA